MIEEQSLNGDLEKIDESIKPLDVGQFMGDDGFELRFVETDQSSCGEQHNGAEPSSNAGCIQMQRFVITHQSGDPHALLQRGAELQKLFRHGRGFFAAKALKQQESSSGAKAQ